MFFQVIRWLSEFVFRESSPCPVLYGPGWEKLADFAFRCSVDQPITALIGAAPTLAQAQGALFPLVLARKVRSATGFACCQPQGGRRRGSMLMQHTQNLTANTVWN
jgi:hypothetical protein